MNVEGWRLASKIVIFILEICNRIERRHECSDTCKFIKHTLQYNHSFKTIHYWATKGNSSYCTSMLNDKRYFSWWKLRMKQCRQFVIHLLFLLQPLTWWSSVGMYYVRMLNIEGKEYVVLLQPLTWWSMCLNVRY